MGNLIFTFSIQAIIINILIINKVNVQGRNFSVMTLAGYMHSQFTLAQYMDFFARILVACICGAAIGFERSMRFKEAGIRTHVIVCCAAALMMIVSKYGFLDPMDASGLTEFGTRAADPARIAAQVVSGVSFLGAGIIFRNGTSIRGLTTAAGMWATAGIGLAVGAGLYIIGLFTTVVIALMQIIMHKFAVSADSLIVGQVHCTVMNSKAFHAAMNAFIKTNKMQIIASKVAFNDDGTSTYDLTMRMNQNTTVNDLTEFLESNEGVREVRCELGK